MNSKNFLKYLCFTSAFAGIDDHNHTEYMLIFVIRSTQTEGQEKDNAVSPLVDTLKLCFENMV